MQRPDFPSERALLSIGRLLGTRIVLTISIVTVLSMVIATTISFLIRGSFSFYSPLIAAACCISTALPVHLALRGYYTLIMNQREKMERQQRELLSLNARLVSTNQDLAAFSHRVAHDLRNPLTVIQLNAHQLREKIDAQGIDSVSDILSAAENAEGIITSILLLSQARQAPPKLQPCNIYESLERALMSLQHRLQEKQITVNVVKNQSLSVIAHEPWLERIWVNLLDNAIKYGGQKPLITAGARLEGERILCWVADNGPGIPPESRALIFQDFQQNIQGASTGFGLGLAMIVQLLKHMNGSIDIEDDPGAKLVFNLKAHTDLSQAERVTGPLECA